MLEALADMEDALSLYLNETSRQQDLYRAADQNRKAVDLANRQYTAGYSGLLDLLVAQRNELDSESSLARIDGPCCARTSCISTPRRAAAGTCSGRSRNYATALSRGAPSRR
ncbi:MAG: hypothetical protein WDO24_07010 [Pseudomonadota bacterium]